MSPKGQVSATARMELPFPKRKAGMRGNQESLIPGEISHTTKDQLGSWM